MNELKSPIKLIRYEAHKGYDDESSLFRVERYEYDVIRETDHCFVIKLWNGGSDKFILKNAIKRFAYPTEELAKNSFERRQEKRYWYAKTHYDMVSAIKTAITAGTIYEKQMPKSTLFGGSDD